MNLKEARRLYSLAKRLNQVRPERFDLGCYVRTITNNNLSVIQELKDKDCGSTACALGYCPLFFPKSWEYSDYSNNWAGNSLVCQY